VVKDQRRWIDAKPCQRETPGGGNSIFESLEVVAALIAEKSCGIETVSELLFNPAKEIWNLVESIDSDRLHWIEEEEASLVGGIETGGLEQDRIRASRDQGMQLLRKRMPHVQSVSI
jgi:hypothetical protein